LLEFPELLGVVYLLGPAEEQPDEEANDVEPKQDDHPEPDLDSTTAEKERERKREREGRARRGVVTCAARISGTPNTLDSLQSS